jgi:outer membrane lipase/esterase
MRLDKAVWAAAILSCLTPNAQAQNFNQLIAFGDSTTDTGWFVNARLSPIANPFDAAVASSLAAGGNGHSTGPGLGNAQILAGFFGLTANPANTPGGTNYAIGGSFDHAGPAPLTAYTNISLVNYALPPNPALPATTGQIADYLASAGGKANPNAIYLISSGGNDIFIASALGLPAASATAYFLSEAQALANGVVQLQAAGARYIIVADEYKPPTLASTGAGLGQTLQAATWSDLAGAGVKFIPADTTSVIEAVKQNPAAFGITHDPTAVGPSAYACLPPLGSGLTSGYGASCAPTTTPSSTHAYLQSANAAQTYLFVDGVHLTEAGQIIVADYYYDLLTAPSAMSFLAESAIQTTFGTIYGIQQQIDLSQRQSPAGWNVWMNGDVSYLQIQNSSSGFPNDPGIPISGTLGADYHWASGWLVGGAVTGGFLSSTFSTGGGFTQDDGMFSLYAGYRDSQWWANLIASVGLFGFSTNRPVPIGITVQPNNGSTFGTDLSVAGEGGPEFHAGPLAHGPVAGFIVQQARVNGFTETGSFTSLSFGTQILSSDVALLGYQMNLNWGMWHPFAQVVWDHDFAPPNGVVNASLTTIAAPGYSMPAVVVGRDWATATAGTEIRFSRSISALASFTAQVGQANLTSYGGVLGLNYTFSQDPPSSVLFKN